MTEDLRKALSDYAVRLHAAAGGGHHVVSPLGAWLVLALCAPLAENDADGGLVEVLGMAPTAAAEAAAALLGNPHPLVAAGAGAWARPRVETAAVRRWRAGLPASVDIGDIPPRADLDAWARHRTLGMIEQFPVDVTADTLLVLATALAAEVSWEKPFSVVAASELGPRSVWSTTLQRVLRAPAGDPRHHQYLVESAQAGTVAVHVASARGGLVVGSVIASDPTIASAEVLAAAEEIVATEARQRRSAPGSSLFALPLGDGPIWTITEEPVETRVATGREERIMSVLPAWSAATTVRLHDESSGFPAAARALAGAMGLDQVDFAAAQSAAARYDAVGFSAAAVTSMAIPASAGPPSRSGLRRTATVRFGHPYAVVAATCADRRTGEPMSGPAWHGLTVFSAWVAQPKNAEPPPSA